MNEHSFTIRGNLMSQSAMKSKSDFEYPCGLMAKMLCNAQKSRVINSDYIQISAAKPKSRAESSLDRSSQDRAWFSLKENRLLLGKAI